MDVDDICVGDRFQRQVEYLVQNPSIVVIGSNASFYYPSTPISSADNNSSIEEFEWAPESMLRGIPTHPVLLQWILL